MSNNIQPLKEKLVGGGTHKFYAANVASTVQNSGTVTINFTVGHPVTVVDEQLLVPSGTHKTGVIARIAAADAAAIAPADPIPSVDVRTRNLEQSLAALASRVTTLENA